MHHSTKCDNLTIINKVTKQKKNQNIDILAQQFTSDPCNFSNIIYVQHYKKTTTQQLTIGLCYDTEGLNNQRI